ncbi:hypothetical protein [Georgenia sp. SYP-B2076]|uniref:hypothetical protein n=1 Tax=Georgenia sp. SYP-B2076 TaxID=2495881 RepID=UPI000F8EC7B5|nr:hypothetical protein [Georgenia sp. SYP-B2076]
MRARTGLAAAAALAVSMAIAAPATAKGGDVGGTGSQYFLSDTFAAAANTVFAYGADGDQALVGDWDGNGTDTLAVRRGSTFFVRNSNGPGPADSVVSYGDPDDTVLVGDWDGDGKDTFIVRRGGLYHVKNSMRTGVADQVIAYGDPGDTVLVGDWDGDGKDTLAVRRGGVYFVKNAMTTGVADHVIAYGNPDDNVLVGDWNGDKTDSLGVRRGISYFLKDTMSSGVADRVLAYGNPDDTTLVGDWNGDGVDSLGVRRTATRPLQPAEPSRPGTWTPNWAGYVEPTLRVASVTCTPTGRTSTMPINGQVVTFNDYAVDVKWAVTDGNFVFQDGRHYGPGQTAWTSSSSTLGTGPSPSGNTVRTAVAIQVLPMNWNGESWRDVRELYRDATVTCP